MSLERLPSNPNAKQDLAEPVADTRWPGVVMITLMLAVLISPVITLGAAVLAYYVADREQGLALGAVGIVGALLKLLF